MRILRYIFNIVLVLGWRRNTILSDLATWRLVFFSQETRLLRFNFPDCAVETIKERVHMFHYSIKLRIVL